eukprot:scaffold69486_cov57-Attheya_sp.AAC.3
MRSSNVRSKRFKSACASDSSSAVTFSLSARPASTNPFGVRTIMRLLAFPSSTNSSNAFSRS